MDSMTVPVNGLNPNAVTKALKRVKGVVGVNIDLVEQEATVTFDETIASAQRLRDIVEVTSQEATEGH
ncbi:heavy-metal-associated domain-containing protein [Alicyclobacillus tolerans]|uniref:heavy-metal-associated domain-containing protein n=1 Tax=Alicyclobacillus tolerans TaxID=90970 RepID=UPI001F491C10|nr:heavy-metal-associated domain-containing protein [Alicyclobacillus tolerans]MCF8565173.1 heavy-metal-associated domain-containing protein [Alicyclobacillus tolerans]